jgi:pyruvate,water dikinase
MAECQPEATWVLAADQAAARAVALVGAKAANLAQLREQVDAVPPWYVVTTAAWTASLAAAGQTERFTTRLAMLSAETAPAIAADLRQWTLALPLPPALEAALLRCHEATLGATGWAALRLSWPAEELPRPPGRLCARRRPHDVLEGLRQCWAEAWTPELLLACQQRGRPLLEAVPAVVVQRLVTAFSSGTLWTANPATGNPQELVIRARFGLAATPDETPDQVDTYLVCKRTMEVQTTLGRKLQLWLRDDDEGGALRCEPILPALQDDSSLRVEDVLHLARLGLLLEHHFGRPLSVSFTVDSLGERQLLRSRPVPAIEEYGPAAGPTQHWDAAPLRRRCPPLLTPLAFSRLRREATQAAQAVATLLGVPAALLHQHATELERLVGLLRGQAFCHLNHWQALAHLAPDRHLALTLLAAALDLPAPPDLSAEHEPPGVGPTCAVSPWHWALTRWRLRRQCRRADHALTQYRAEAELQLGQLAAHDLAQLTPHHLLAHYQTLERLLCPPLIVHYRALTGGEGVLPTTAELRARLLAEQDRLLLTLGAYFAGEGLLAQAGDLDYLTLDELLDFLAGTAATTDLRALAGLRRAEFARYRAQPEQAAAERCETYGMAYHRNRFRPSPTPPSPSP